MTYPVKLNTDIKTVTSVIAEDRKKTKEEQRTETHYLASFDISAPETPDRSAANRHLQQLRYTLDDFFKGKLGEGHVGYHNEPGSSAFVRVTARSKSPEEAKTLRDSASAAFEKNQDEIVTDVSKAVAERMTHSAADNVTKNWFERNISDPLAKAQGL